MTELILTTKDNVMAFDNRCRQLLEEQKTFNASRISQMLAMTLNTKIWLRYGNMDFEFI